MKKLSAAAAGMAMFFVGAAHAGFGGMSDAEYDGGSSPFFGPHLAAMALGAAMGYFSERAYNKYKLDRAGSRYTSEWLGGKAGALIGCFALPLLIGLLR